MQGFHVECKLTIRIGQGAGTNPIHNKKKKAAKKDEDEDDVAFKQKQMAGASTQTSQSHEILDVRVLICRV